MPHKEVAPYSAHSSLVELLQSRSLERPDQVAFSFVPDGSSPVIDLTYRQLDFQARRLAARLQADGLMGQRALLVYLAGLEYLIGFFGCLYAGVVAVPVYPPRANRSQRRIDSIVADVDARIALTSRTVLQAVERCMAESPLLASLRWLVTEELSDDLADQWQTPAVDRSSLAFLQFTSGSTGNPKGVMVSHGNLLANVELIRQGFQVDQSVRGASWLPMYHDMGLIGGILTPIFLGGSSVLMSPTTFLQRPLNWLQAISRTRATAGGAPNFGYDLCVERTTPEQRAQLDLSSWRVAFCGSEPIRKDTLDRFAEAFAVSGFRRESFYPCYGMAEATLLICGGQGPGNLVSMEVDRAALAQHRAVLASPGDQSQILVSSGSALGDHEVVIVDPPTRTLVADGAIGEIWTRGSSIAAGYWNKPELSQATFGAFLANQAEGPTYLRTGDLGFMRAGQLYVTGRIKDLIIIRGRNYYPQDIEATVVAAHPAVAAAPGAALSIDVDDREQLVIVQEVGREFRRGNLDDVLAAILNAIANEHELQPASIVLCQTATVARTTSGKISRQACRGDFLENRLSVLAQWHAPAKPSAQMPSATPASSETNSTPDCQQNGQPSGRSIRQIETWLLTNVAEQLQCDPARIDIHRPLAEHGLDSAAAIGISGDLEDWLGRRVEPTLIYDYPTISSIASYLAGGEVLAHDTASMADLNSPPATPPEREPIALIGIGCRFPGADCPEAFWKLLCGGVDAISEVSPERWDRTQFDDVNPTNPLATNTRWGGFLKDVDQFDPAFFGISPREATYIDPQQRLLLEVTHEALEDAGLPSARLAGSATGVFVGISTNDYAQLPLDDLPGLDPYWSIGNALSIAANRLSYVLDLRGPSLAVDTACSSSLVAVHLACRSLLSGESTLALAGGANLMLSPAIAISFSRGGALSPDGRCKAFDARANGIVRGEGAGVVVLKRLSQAVADGDRIYAVIRGGAVNQDGRTNGIAAPNQSAQENVLRAAYTDAKVLPSEIQYVEAHGTGTLLGDPIEMKALGAVLGENRQHSDHEGRKGTPQCAVGSVKTNIGHLEAAAGVAGLIKTALALRHAQLPPTLHFSQPNPHIPFDSLPLVVPTQLVDWRSSTGRLLAGVSAFGFGGTNAHLVLESIPPTAAAASTASLDARPVRLPLVLPLSARSEPALAQVAVQISAWLARKSPAADEQKLLADLCYTAGNHRTQHDHRTAIVFNDREMLQDKLAAIAASPGAATPRVVLRRAPIVFVYSGHEAQWWGMGRTLLTEQPVFHEVIAECDRLLRPLASWSLLKELQADEADSRVTAREVEISQTALFAVQIGLTALWRSWGVVPDAVVGHSVGEVAAAHVAGALTLADALQVVFHRSRLMQRGIELMNGHGSMAAVRLSIDEAQQALGGWEDRLSVAVSNSPDYTILSGDAGALAELLALLKRQRVASRLLAAPGAGHSPQVEPLRGELENALRGIAPREVTIPLLSTVTLTWPSGRMFDAAYWGRNLREPVRFAGAVGELIGRGMTTFLEIGPHPILASAITQCGREKSVEPVVLASLKRQAEDWQTLAESLAALFAGGTPIDWSAIYPTGQRLELPSYPWQRQRCWLEGPPPWSAESQRRKRGQNNSVSRSVINNWLDRRIDVAAQPGMLCWESDVSRARLSPVSPGGAALITISQVFLLELVRSALAEVNPKGAVVLANLQFSEALELVGEQFVTLQITLQPLGDGECEFQVHSRDPNGAAGSAKWLANRWTRRLSGRAQHVVSPAPQQEATSAQSVNGQAKPPTHSAAEPVRSAPMRPAASIRVQLRAAADNAERRSVVESLLRQELGRVVKLDPATIDPHVLLTHYNIDSLMVVELKNSLEDALETLISPAAVFQHPTIASLAGYLVELLESPSDLPPAPKLVAEASPAVLPAWAETLVRDPVVLAAQLDNLSDVEVDSLLDALVSERLVTDEDFHAWMAESIR